jgi:DNA-binding NarL/FixJ family response regulator
MNASRKINSSIDTTSLWVVEDDAMYRNSIQEVLNQMEGMRCEHAFSSCEEVLKLMEKEYAPEVVLMDIGLPGMDGIEGLKRIKSISPATDIIMLTIHEEDDKVFKAICSGANGYLLKSSTSEEIIHAIKEVQGGGAPINAQIARKVLDMIAHTNPPTPDYGLTNREKEILHLIVEGLTLKQTADKVFLSYHTVDTHVRNIYSKLQVHSRAALVAKSSKERL